MDHTYDLFAHLHLSNKFVHFLNLGDRGIITTTTLGTNGGEQGVLLNLGTPSLVICKMPVEHIHLIDGHEINHLLHLFDGEKMTAHVKHETTVRKAWLILNPCYRN